MSTISSTAVDNIKRIVDAAVANPTKDLPGASVVVVNRRGDLLIDYAAGLQGLEPGANPLKSNAVYWLASCTKLAVAALALVAVEEGKIFLDDSKQIEKLCPELRSIPILESIDKETGKIVLVPKTKKITLRMLLTHTAGFSYTHLNPKLAAYGRIFGINEGTGLDSSVLMPLISEPGTRFSYGVGVDWAANAITRAYNRTLDDLIQEKLFVPIGIKDTTFIPNKDMKDRTVTVSFRKNDGTLVPTPRLKHRAQAEDPTYAASGYQYGGSGLYTTPPEFSKLFATLLNGGVSPYTNTRVLSQASVDEMFTNQIPDWPDFGRQYPMTSCIPAVANSLPEIFHQPGNPPQGWGLTFFLNLVPLSTGRRAYSAYWCGISNLYYWIDREAGIAAFVSAQILPFSDEKMIRFVDKVEREIYKGLQEKPKL
ncbi:uncharacterized protein SAPINGB_P004874 [Magnusiomyces paraingens]|uniref:Beta-lactamase-related domain-containing protein n=1 Tax=Magnusiomyces paraingens TaxID=2606893 RepID=A0A5E8C334_9ASCO|nr:uncharacterized protein SAPINGB_P004874 [Saprochaete ingens]VVT56168.1 unnamed protein product [Saprochaete ingens]